jgi:hypothetical protein
MCSKLAGQQFIKQLKDNPQIKENKGRNAGVIINITSVMEQLVRKGKHACMFLYLFFFDHNES